jgi:hypothetical protein
VIAQHQIEARLEQFGVDTGTPPHIGEMLVEKAEAGVRLFGET